MLTAERGRAQSKSLFGHSLISWNSATKDFAILLLLESGVGENNAHPRFCVRGNPAPRISMLLGRCNSDQRKHPRDERFFRHRVHSRRERIASTLNSGARGSPDAPRGPMSVIFANTGTPKILLPPTFPQRDAAVFSRSHVSRFESFQPSYGERRRAQSKSLFGHSLISNFDIRVRVTTIPSWGGRIFSVYRRRCGSPR